MNDVHRPTEPAGEPGQAPLNPTGFTGIARHLNGIHPGRPRPISRQLVYKWYRNRHYNLFPEPVAIIGTGTGHPVFDLQAVENWYRQYRKYRGEELPAAAHRTTPPPGRTAGEEDIAA